MKALLQKALDALVHYELLVEDEWGSCRSTEEIEAAGETDPIILELRAAIEQLEVQV